jgi:hypothetical protein
MSDKHVAVAVLAHVLSLGIAALRWLRDPHLAVRTVRACNAQLLPLYAVPMSTPLTA